MRHAVIPVDDPDIRGLEVSAYDGERKRRWTRPFWVPQDDQLTRDVSEAIRIVEGSGWSHRHDLSARLRAAFNLGTEGES